MKKFNLALLLVVLGATVFLFYYLNADAKSSLFYVNLFFTCFLELLFLSSVVSIAKERLFNPPNLAIVYQICYYIFTSAIIVLAYNIYFREFFVIKWYIGAILLISLLFFVLIFFAFRGAKAQLADSKEVDNLILSRNLRLGNYSQLKIELNSAISSKDITLIVRDKCVNSINLLVDIANSIPLAKAERNSEFVQSVNEKISSILLEIKNLNKLDEKEAFIQQVTKLTSMAEGIISYIKITNNSLK